MTSQEYSRRYGRMKTTVELPDGLAHRAKTVALQRGITLKRLIIEGLEEVTRAAALPPADLGEEDAEFLEIDAHGVAVLKRPGGLRQRVSDAEVDRLRDELGV